MTAPGLIGSVIATEIPSNVWIIDICFDLTEILSNETVSILNRVFRLPTSDKLWFLAFTNFPVNEAHDHVTFPSRDFCRLRRWSVAALRTARGSTTECGSVSCIVVED